MISNNPLFNMTITVFLGGCESGEEQQILSCIVHFRPLNKFMYKDASRLGFGENVKKHQ
jgi:hypothetical protein